MRRANGDRPSSSVRAQTERRAEAVVAPAEAERSSATSAWRFSRASSSGVLPPSSFSSALAPWKTSHFTTLRWPREAAKCSGVAPSPSRVVTGSDFSRICRGIK